MPYPIIDQPAETAEAEHDERKAGCEDGRPFPGKLCNPAENTAAAAQPSGDFQRCRDGENRQQRRHRHKDGEQHLDELPAVAVLWVHHQMMHSDRQAKDQKQNEGETAHRIAIEASACRARDHRVKRDVCRNEPEIDDGVQRPREQRARQTCIDGLHDAQRCRNDLEKQFSGHADGGPKPHHRVCDRCEHRQRHGLPWIFAFPLAHRDEHENAPDP